MLGLRGCGAFLLRLKDKECFLRLGWEACNETILVVVAVDEEDDGDDGDD